MRAHTHMWRLDGWMHINLCIVPRRRSHEDDVNGRGRGRRQLGRASRLALDGRHTGLGFNAAFIEL